ncbi:MAG: hypothetical protein ACRD5H_17685, partial [Nitrososphaerales archaeon]
CILCGIMFYRCPHVLLKYRVHPKQLSGELKNSWFKNEESIRGRIRKQYISKYGKGKWCELLNEFKKRGKVRPLWRQIGHKLLMHAPPSIRQAAIEEWHKRK